MENIEEVNVVTSDGTVITHAGLADVSTEWKSYQSVPTVIDPGGFVHVYWKPTWFTIPRERIKYVSWKAEN